MEIRTLRYFMAVAEEGNITQAAKKLHMTQPALSREIKLLEEQYKKQLLIRGNRNVSLTDDGLYLKIRAAEILKMADDLEHTMEEQDSSLVYGDIYISTGETKAFQTVAKVIAELKNEYPALRFHVYSGDGDEVEQRLRKGKADFAILFESNGLNDYNYRKLPILEDWGVYMRKDDPLSANQIIVPEHLKNKPLVLPERMRLKKKVASWMGCEPAELNVAAEVNLSYNSTLLVKAGAGYFFSIAGMVDIGESSELTFRNLSPSISDQFCIVWRKDSLYSRSTNVFLNAILKI